VSVDRGSPPFTGKFSGKQNDQGAETTMTTQFACYPASDSDIPQARAFVCYTGGSNGGGAPGAGGGPPRYGSSNGGPPPYGPPPGSGSDYGPPGGGPPNGPPPGVE
jgi:hypothetical protein